MHLREETKYIVKMVDVLNKRLAGISAEMKSLSIDSPPEIVKEVFKLF